MWRVCAPLELHDAHVGRLVDGELLLRAHQLLALAAPVPAQTRHRHQTRHTIVGISRASGASGCAAIGLVPVCLVERLHGRESCQGLIQCAHLPVPQLLSINGLAPPLRIHKKVRCLTLPWISSERSRNESYVLLQWPQRVHFTCTPHHQHERQGLRGGRDGKSGGHATQTSCFSGIHSRGSAEEG